MVETITEAEARRLTTEAQTEFRSSVDHFDRAWAIVNNAVRGTSLSANSWAADAEDELRPTEGIATDVRRQLVRAAQRAGHVHQSESRRPWAAAATPIPGSRV